MGIVPGQRLLSALVLEVSFLFWKCPFQQNLCKETGRCPVPSEMVTCPTCQDRAARDEPSSGKQGNGAGRSFT